MNAQELNVFNHFLDGKKLPLLEEIHEQPSELILVAVKEELIRKEFMSDSDHFTAMGARIGQRLRDYKDAEKHVQFDLLYLGYLPDREYVQILYNPFNQEYRLERGGGELTVTDIHSFYPFLEFCKAEQEKEVLLSANLSEEYPVSADRKIYIRTEKQGKQVSKELFFEWDFSLYLYDYLEKRLQILRKDHWIQKILERINR